MDGGGQKYPSLPTQNPLYIFQKDKIWQSYTLTKEDPKNSSEKKSSDEISIFYQKLTIFVISRNKDKNCILIHMLLL